MLEIFRSKAIHQTTRGTILDEDEDPLGLWKEYEDPDPQVKMLLNTIGEEADRPAKPIPVKKLDRPKKVYVHIGFPTTLKGALSRQTFRRKTRARLPRKRDFIPQKLRLDARRVH
jgi:hypothetical protein